MLDPFHLMMSDILLSGCAILEDGRLLLVRKKEKDFWELPGGIVDSKKDIEAAAVDKTKNQIGVEPTVVQQFTILEYQKDANNIEASIFECIVDQDATFIPGENIDEIRWFPVSDVSDEKIGEDVVAILEEL